MPEGNSFVEAMLGRELNAPKPIPDNIVDVEPVEAPDFEDVEMTPEEVAEQRRLFAIQVASGIAQNSADDLIRAAASVEAYLRAGTVPQGVPDGPQAAPEVPGLPVEGEDATTA